MFFLFALLVFLCVLYRVSDLAFQLPEKHQALKNLSLSMTDFSMTALAKPNYAIWPCHWTPTCLFVLFLMSVLIGHGMTFASRTESAVYYHWHFIYFFISSSLCVHALLGRISLLCSLFISDMYCRSSVSLSLSLSFSLSRCFFIFFFLLLSDIVSSCQVKCVICSSYAYWAHEEWTCRSISAGFWFMC